tara:strand:- start:181 stop:621 length:441 start_codon:yes stop_codon:yes gene_type:complete
MPYTSDTEIEHIARGLIDRTLPLAEWTHAAHFAAALWLIAEDRAAAHANMPGMIRAYNEASGGVNSDTEGYHETITQASLGAAHSLLSKAAAGTPLHVVLRDLMASEYGKSTWLMTYWSKPVLFSVEARRGWVGPDLKPLPFDVQA